MTHNFTTISWSFLVAVGTAVGWLWMVINAVRAKHCQKFLEDYPLLRGDLNVEHLPVVDVVVAARNEAESLPTAISSLLRQTYPRLRVVVVDDRSVDSTPAILREMSASSGGKLTVIRIDECPPGWLGKCHALHVGAQSCNGDYVLFTDADVIWAPTAIERSVACILEENPDHLCVFPSLETRTIGERIFALGFAQLFFAYWRPYRAEEPRSNSYVGVGAFNMVRRRFYEKLGGHRPLRLTVVDDVALGKLLKFSGARTWVLLARSEVRVRWQKGLIGSIRGVEKNAFAGLGYSFVRTAGAIAGASMLWLAPWCVALRASSPTIFFIALAGLICQLAYGWGVAKSLGVSPFYGILAPVSVSLCLFALARSAVLTLLHRGVWWRDTFYPLEELKKYDKLK
jgi:cellulose synthase/poly-beta-1,6-N-acetylglucosamine synthase-like glycosyltransferase